jgi:nucleoid DNA-binding protein
MGLHHNQGEEEIMVNLDYPGVCLSCVDERCHITPPDLSLSRERVHGLTTGYALEVVKTLKDTFPDKFSTLEEAYQVLDALKAMLVNGLKIHTAVDIEGIGTFRAVPGGKAGYSVAFDADPRLTDHYHETNPPEAEKAKELLQNTRGYSLTIMKVLRDTFPHKLSSLEEAYRVFYVMRALLANGFEKGEVELEGIGTFKTSGEGKVDFEPQQVLLAAVNE